MFRQSSAYRRKQDKPKGGIHGHDLFTAGGPQDTEEGEEANTEFLTLGKLSVGDSEQKKTMDCYKTDRRLCTGWSRYGFSGKDGICNNLDAFTLGSAKTAFRRLLPPSYHKPANTSIGYLPRKAVNGEHLPNARQLSLELFKIRRPKRRRSNTNVMFMQMGQFISHDVAFSTGVKAANCPCGSKFYLQQHQRRSTSTLWQYCSFFSSRFQNLLKTPDSSVS